MTFNLEEAREAFEQFLMLMDGQMEWLVAQAQTHGIELDGSPESLDRLERLHDLMAATLSEDERDSLRVVFARYLGETVRLVHGGKWALPLMTLRTSTSTGPSSLGTHATPCVSSVPSMRFAPTRFAAARADQKHRSQQR